AGLPPSHVGVHPQAPTLEQPTSSADRRIELDDSTGSAGARSRHELRSVKVEDLGEKPEALEGGSRPDAGKLRKQSIGIPSGAAAVVVEDVGEVTDATEPGRCNEPVYDRTLSIRNG